MIIIVDYGIGNIQSLVNMYEFLGIDVISSSDAQIIAEADRLILPGVGAFDHAMNNLKKLKIIPALNYAAQEKKTPILGICLGMQLLARSSEEGTQAGLGWINADVHRISVQPGSNLKIPHMGWSEVTPTRPCPLFQSNVTKEYFYFVHSYHMVCDSPNHVLATINYDQTICCAINNENIWGVQFHPEKSHKFGMNLLSKFALI